MDTSTTPLLSQLSILEAAHCRLPFSPLATIESTGADLPYHALGGPGFERLCFELLIKGGAGSMPRFFGKSGQSQYGIDLIAEEQGVSVVYQCKNLKSDLSETDLGAILKLFETEWIGRTDLPVPKRFVLCCPRDFADTKARDYWETQRGKFQERTGVELATWLKADLDSRLRKAPDIVADSFSDRAANDFCDAGDWRHDQFWSIKDGAGLPFGLTRYGEHRKAGRLYRDPDYEKDLEEKLERNRVVLIRGLPGSGKTMMALAFACAFQDGQWRVYYINVARDNATTEMIVRGIRQRLSRPALFVLDDVHGEKETAQVQAVLDRLQDDLRGNRLAIICIARHVPSEAEERGDDSDLYKRLEDAQATIAFKNEPQRFANMVGALKPDFIGLSPARMAKLEALTGRDFLLLDELLQDVKRPGDIDQLDQTTMSMKVRKRYFGAGSVHLPAITRLAAPRYTQLESKPISRRVLMV